MIGNKFGPICTTHKFCSVPYYFKDEKKSRKEIDKDEVHNNNKYLFNKESSLILSRHQEALPNCHVKVMNGALANVSEEALDDWIFQSFNRPLMGFLDPKKKFEIVNSYLEDLKTRYYSLRMSNKLTLENKEYYFQDEQQISKKQRFILQNGKQILNPSNLLFDHLYLQPKEVWPGQNIMIREEINLKRKKQSESRRNAIYLTSDDNYNKLYDELKSQDTTRLNTSHEKAPSYKEDSIQEVVETPIRDSGRQLKYFAHLMPEIFRNPQPVERISMNSQKTRMSKLTNLSNNRFDTIQYQLSAQHTKFKQEMEALVKDFKEFIKENGKDAQETLKQEIKVFEKKIIKNKSNNKLNKQEGINDNRNQNTSLNSKLVIKKAFISNIDALKKPQVRMRMQSQSEKRQENQVRYRSQSRGSTTRNQGLAKQMIDWYEIGKEERYSLPKELKEEMQRAHKSQDDSEQASVIKILSQNLVQSRKSADQMKHRRHLVLKECETVISKPLEISILHD